MARFLMSVALLLVLIAGVHPGAAARGAGGGRHLAREVPLDLAAMVLTPTDLDAEGLSGFRIQPNGSFGIEGVDAYVADFGRSDEDRDALEEAGWLRRYDGALSLPADPPRDAPHDVAFGVDSYVTEYASAGGAADGFTLLQGSSAGDEPVVDRGEDVVSDGDVDVPYQYFDLSFRIGNITAGVTLSDFGGAEPEQDLVEALAKRLQERIELVQDRNEPGLSTQLLLIGGPDVVLVGEIYSRQDGDTFPVFGQSAQTQADRVTFAGESLEVYTAFQQLPATNDADAYIPTYAPTINHFADADTASAWLADSPVRAAAVYGTVRVIDETQIGDESLTIEISAFGDPEREGFRVLARVGSDVITVELLAPSGVDQSLVENLAGIQVECVEQTGRCERIGVEDALGAFTPSNR